MTKRLCYKCMRELKRESQFCTQCGFSYNKYLMERKQNTLMPGTILNDRYMVGTVLGAGGFGITYVGYDQKLDIKIAIKEYFPASRASRVIQGQNDNSDLLADYGSPDYKNGLRQFLKEARIIAKFNKEKGIVSVTDYFEANKTAYYVMDFLPGRSLKSIIDSREDPVSEQEIIYMLRPIIIALRSVHREGIVHRDISPDNMVEDHNGRLTLIDFGAAKLNDYGEVESWVQLKHGYAPLEQYSLDGEQGPWTDVYALCATIYYMMSHAKPIAANKRAQGEHLLSLEELGLSSPSFSNVVSQGLAVEYNHRFKNLDALVTAFYEEPEPEIIIPDQTDPPVSILERVLTIILAGCCIILAVIIFLYFYKN